MPSIKRSSKQVAKDRAALKRLKKSGSYSGKIDLRKAPSKYQLKKLAALRARAKSKTSAKKLAALRARAKSKTSAKNKRPAKQKITGARITQSEISAKKLATLKEPKHKLTTYALPFLRKGQDEPEWRRFTYKQLRAFLSEYKADDPEGAAEWQSYAVAEKWTFDAPAEVAAMRKDTNVYFSGVRIADPNGKIRKKIKRSKRAPRKRGKKK